MSTARRQTIWGLAAGLAAGALGEDPHGYRAEFVRLVALAEDLERIFSPFEQSTNQDRNLEGTGLGLTLTQRMVQLHGGVIQAESSGRDQGATFTIVLPDVTEISAS